MADPRWTTEDPTAEELESLLSPSGRHDCKEDPDEEYAPPAGDESTPDGAQSGEEN